MTGMEFWLEPAVTASVSRLAAHELAIDVGANTGTWTRTLSLMFDKVIACEPDPRASDVIPRRLNVEIRNIAVADVDGTRELFLRPSPDQNSLLEIHPIGAGGMSPAPVLATVDVACESLDSICPEGADFVKIDVEGAELLVLAGCVDVPRWARTVFVVECHDTFSQVEALLIGLGKGVTHVPHPLVAHPGHCWAIGE